MTSDNTMYGKTTKKVTKSVLRSRDSTSHHLTSPLFEKMPQKSAASMMMDREDDGKRHQSTSNALDEQ
jgi:hypothetical protein